MLSKMFVLGGLIWFVIPVSSGDPHHHQAMIASVVSAEMQTPEIVKLEKRSGLFKSAISFLNQAQPQRMAAALSRFNQVNAVIKRSTKSFVRIEKQIADLRSDVTDITGKNRFHRNVFADMKSLSGQIGAADGQISTAAREVQSDTQVQEVDQ